MSMSYLNAVAEVATLAGDFAMSYYRSSLDVDLKRDGSPVTVADRGAERVARDWIEKRFPDHGILGEEFGEIRPGAKRRWIIDPIDGTKSFIRGVPLWGTLVAVAEGDSVLAGCACFPAIGETVVAAQGEGCFWNGAPCGVSSQNVISESTVLVTDDRFRDKADRLTAWRSLADQVGIVRTWGDCYGYLLIATGRADVMIDDIVAPWDSAALYPIVTEAGGVFTDWLGDSTPFGGDVIATNAALARPVRQILIPGLP